MSVQNTIYYIATSKHSYVLPTYLDGFGKEIAHLFTQIHIESMLEQDELHPGVYIFTDHERATPAQLHLLSYIYGAMEKSGGAYRLLNDPRKVLRRYELLRKLADRGLNRFTAYRLNEIPQELTTPLFLRIRREHGGALTEPIADRALLDESIAAILMHGVDPDNLIAVEYCDTRGPDELFRKYAAQIIGKRVISRSLWIGESWEIKHHARLYEPEIVAEEDVYVKGNPHEAELKAIFDLAHIDFGRIDYSLKDGRTQTWEINTNPVIAEPPADLDPSRLETNRFALDGIERAFEELAAEPLTDDVVSLNDLSLPLEHIIRQMK